MIRRTIASALLLASLGCTAEPMRPVVAAPDRWSALADWDTTDRLVQPARRENLTALSIRNPHSAIAQRRLLQLAVQQQDADGARKALDRMHGLGLALSPQAYGSIGTLIGADSAADYSSIGEALRTPILSSTLAATIAPSIPLAEAFAFDEATGRYFTGSVTDRSLHVSDDGREWTWVPTRTLGSIAGLAIDARTNTLWIASGRLDPTKQPETAFVGLVALDLETLQEKRRVSAPRDVRTLGDLVILDEGAVLVSDPLGSGVYRLGPGRGQLETLIAPGHLASPQGIAAHPSGDFVYVADWAYGVVIVDLAARTLKRLDAQGDFALDGVDGMIWHDGALVVIQNGLNPFRIVRWTLDEDGYAVTAADVLERAHPDWGEPTVGQRVGDRLLYASDPQWDRFEEGGAAKGEEPLRPNPIRSISLAN